MRFACSSYFVPDVPKTVAFYQRAFGLRVHHMHATKSYAELDTGTTRLTFLSEAFLVETQVFGSMRIRRNRPDEDPPAAMIVLGSEDVQADYTRAVQAGATPVAAPEMKPWGEHAGYVRDPDGIIIEIVKRLTQ
jgi:uncharacterized glyoxalase superfamily protein PhnB